jgi:hypothetical protein
MVIAMLRASPTAGSGSPTALVKYSREKGRKSPVPRKSMNVATTKLLEPRRLGRPSR